MILVADGLVFQRGKPLNLPDSINADDAKHLHVADVSLLLAEEQDNFFQIIALPIPQTVFAEADKCIVVDVPERKADLIVYDAKASECKAWIKKTVDLDRRRAEEDAAESEEDEREADEEEEEEQEEQGEEQASPPQLLPAPMLTAQIIPVQHEPPPAVVVNPAAVQAVGQLAPEPIGQLEVISPIPLQLDDEKQGA